jgi:hypothetical protein
MAATLKNLVSMMRGRRRREEWEWKRRSGRTGGKKNTALALELMRIFTLDDDVRPAVDSDVSAKN